MALDQAGRGRFRGVRYTTAADDHPPLSMYDNAPMDSSAFLDGLRTVGELGYTFDAMVYHPQLPLLAAAARACPDTPIVIDHLGGFLGTGPYKDRRDEILSFWYDAMAELAALPNTFLKTGGIGMPMMGYRWDKQATPATSEDLAEDLAEVWAEPIQRVIELFGPPPLHVRVELPGRPTRRWLRRSLERIQAHCGWLLPRRETVALPRHRSNCLPRTAGRFGVTTSS